MPTPRTTVVLVAPVHRVRLAATTPSASSAAAAAPASAHPPRPGRPFRHRPGRDRDGGQTTVVVALVVGLALVMLVGLTRLGAATVHRAQARTAADAAALAAVVDQPRGGGAGRRAATEIAAANGATVTDYEVDGTAVEVTVRVEETHASSRAELAVVVDQ